MAIDMNQQAVSEVMTSDPVTIGSRQTVMEAAQMMRDYDIGDLIVTDDSAPMGIITDRDIVVRAIADGRDISATEVGQVCSKDVSTVSPNDATDVAVTLMRTRAIRRLPVVSDGRIVGIVGLGDMAVERDPRSALADISAATPNH
jgi:CBS domain-containing protein